MHRRHTNVSRLLLAAAFVGGAGCLLQPVGVRQDADCTAQANNPALPEADASVGKPVVEAGATGEDENISTSAALGDAGGAPPFAPPFEAAGGQCHPDVTVVDLQAEGAPVQGGFVLVGRRSGDLGRFDGSCVATIPSGGAEVVVRFEPEVGGDLMVSTAGSDFDTVLYVRRRCEDATAELGCSDDVNPAVGLLTSGLVLENAARVGHPLFVFVDGPRLSTETSFRLTVTVREVRALGDSCDATGTTNRCDKGLICAQRACVPNHQPVLREASFFTVSERRGRLALRGSDPARDVEWVVLRWVSEEGEITTPEPLKARSFQVGSPSFLWQYDGLDAVRSDGDATLEVTLLDAAGLTSETVRVEPLPLPRRRTGESCDPDEFFDVCEAGTSCVSGRCEAR